MEELRKKFASRRIMGEVTKLEELMQSLDITISREGSKGHQAMPQEKQEDMDWKVVEVSEHALLDQWQMELSIEVLDDGDWNMLDIELEHGYLDRLIDMMEKNAEDTVQDVRWRKPVDDDDGLKDTITVLGGSHRGWC